MQSSAAASTTTLFTHRQRTDMLGYNHHRPVHPRVTTRSNMIQPVAKPIQADFRFDPMWSQADDEFPQPAPYRDFYHDTFFNPVWMSGPHVFSFAKDGKVVRPETYRVEPYPGYRASAASSSRRGTALSLSGVSPSTLTSCLRTDVSKPSARIEKPWKNVAITEHDDAEFAAMDAGAKLRAQAEAKGKLVGLVYTWPPKPQAVRCAECETLARPRRQGVVVPQVRLDTGTDVQESVAPALSYGSSGESEPEWEAFKMVSGRRVMGRRKDPMEKCVGFGRVTRKAQVVPDGAEEGEGINGWTCSAPRELGKVDDEVWNPFIPETWVEDELTVRLKAILRIPDD